MIGEMEKTEGTHMLQDLAYGRLENEYRPTPPRDTDSVLCFRDPDVLLHRDEQNLLTLPTAAHFPGQTLRYAFRLHGIGYYLLSGADVEAPAPFAWVNTRALRRSAPDKICYAILTGWHLHTWYQHNRFCGGCGAETIHDETERMLRCPVCGNLIFPRINPAVIAAVTDGDNLLLSRYAGRSYTSFALLAGYAEIGETIEQTVTREVYEEVGLKVKNLRYYKSQPWGVDGNLLLGFFCDLDGDDTIRLDEHELSHAAWYPRNGLPVADDGFSLTREMIRVFSEGKEPR